MMILMILLVLLALIAFPTAAAAWALIEAGRIEALNTGDYSEE